MDEVKQFLKESLVNYKDAGSQYFKDDNKYSTVLILEPNLNNWNFFTLQEFMINYRKKHTNSFIELCYTQIGLYIKYR